LVLISACGNVHVKVLQVLHIAQILRRDLGDGNVINVDVLLAHQVQQQVERAIIDLADADRKWELVGLVPGGL